MQHTEENGPFGESCPLRKMNRADGHHWFMQHVVGCGVKRWDNGIQDKGKWWLGIRQSFMKPDLHTGRANTLLAALTTDCITAFKEGLAIVDKDDGVLVGTYKDQLAALLEEAMVVHREWARSVIPLLWKVCKREMTRLKMTNYEIVSHMKPWTWTKRGDLAPLSEFPPDKGFAAHMWRHAVVSLMCHADTGRNINTINLARQHMDPGKYRELVMRHAHVAFKSVQQPIPTWSKYLAQQGMSKKEYESLVWTVLDNNNLYLFLRRFPIVAGNFQYDHPLLAFMRSITYDKVIMFSWQGHWWLLDMLATASEFARPVCFVQQWQELVYPVALLHVMKHGPHWEAKARAHTDKSKWHIIEMVKHCMEAHNNPLTAWSKFVEVVHPKNLLLDGIVQ